MPTRNSATLIESRDIDEYAELLGPWDVVLRQVSVGPYHARSDYVYVGGIHVTRHRVAQREMGTGASPAGCFTFVSPLSPGNSINYCGVESTPQRLCYARPDSEVDFISPAGTDHAIIAVPTDLMRGYFGNDTIDAALADNRHFLGLKSQRDCNIAGIVTRIVAKYLAQPELLTDPSECKAIESQLMDTVAEVFPDAGVDMNCMDSTRRREVFLDAIDRCEDLRAPITVPELAAASGVSPRTLRLAFQESLGISPYKYMLWRRLQKVHNDLYRKDAGSTSVTDSAMAWGFTELGRFAVQYKRRFGESPSQTLRSVATSSPKAILDLLLNQQYHTARTPESPP